MKRRFTILTAALALLTFLIPVVGWGQEPTQLFHETFGNNSGSAREWNDSYSVKSGIEAVYENVVYTMTNLKQSKNTVGHTQSGLLQSSTESDAVFEFGPLQVADYSSLSLDYYWKAGSIKATYSTHIYYKTSLSGQYSEISHSAQGATTFVPVNVSLPVAAQTNTLFLKIVWNTSNTQAVIDEVNITGVSNGGGDTPTHAYTLNVTGADDDAEVAIYVDGQELGADDEIAEGKTVTVSVIPSEGYTYSVAVLDANNVAVEYDEEMDSFTMPTSAVTITVTTAAIPTHSATFSVNGTTTTQSFAEGATITFPAAPGSINGKVFVGWTATPIEGTTTNAPEMVNSATMGTNDVTFYAVFADETPGTTQSASNTITPGTENIPDSYGTANTFSEYSLTGVNFMIQQMYKNGQKLQWRAAGNTSGTGTMYNSDAMLHIQSVVLTYDESDANKNFTLSVGDDANPTNGTAITPTANGLVYTFDCSSYNKNYFVLTNGSGAGYLSQIVINYLTGTPSTYSNYCTTVELPAVEMPVISIAQNPFEFSTTVTITCATDGATIYYTTDGNAPTANSNIYSESFTINSTTTIKAMAIKGSDESTIAEVTAIKELATPTVEISSLNIDLNGTATVTTDGPALTLTTSDASVASVSGTTVTGVAAGTATITATWSANNDYSGGTKDFTIVVTDPNAGAGTILFGNQGTNINAASVTGTDSNENTWTITTVGTTSFTQSTEYSQVGSGSKPATSITFTTTLPNSVNITSFSAKFGGFNNTVGDVTLKVGETTVGTGSLNGPNDVTVSNTAEETGTVLTVTVTNIDKGVKCYFISYEYEVASPVLELPITANQWYLIASPVGNVDIDDVDNLTSGNHGLYSFDQTGGTDGKEWRNYKTDAFSQLEAGKGYLYINQEGCILTFTGTANNNSTAQAQLVYSTSNETESFHGLNLIGNPLNATAYLEDGRPFYVMNGNVLAAANRTNIAPMEGVFVVATGVNDNSVTFTTTQPTNGDKGVVLNLSQNRGSLEDRAIVRFGEGSQLPKVQLFETNADLYIPQGDKNYAVVRSEGQGELPVNFRASENGTYTLSMNVENMDMNYLHLIDNMTGMDIDLLQTPSYTFEAKVNDYESRFRLVFAANNEDGVSTGSTAFAFYSNGSWIINNAGEATLQVVDLTGRILSSETVNGSVSKTLNAVPGIYMLRLINGDNVNVQKIVVR